MSDERDADESAGADEPAPPSKSLGQRVAGGAEAVVEAVADAGEAIAAAVDDVLHPVAATRRRRDRRRAARLLPNLYDVHPEARSAPLREVGLAPIPVSEIIGTAVDGPAQRGPDFKPLRELRSENWRGRWQRIRVAVERLQTLPPIDVLKTSEGYWVVDGHNRVAAAKAAGQVAIDASIRAVRLPGEKVSRPTGPLAPLLEGASELRAAGRGLLTPGANRSAVGHDHERVSEPADHPDEERLHRS